MATTTMTASEYECLGWIGFECRRHLEGIVRVGQYAERHAEYAEIQETSRHLWNKCAREYRYFAGAR